jgi:ssDNA-binding Zn-finger/Zn-ribbon topoisomerase 1
MTDPKMTGEQCELCREGFLIERVNSINKHTFIGCSEWPVCKFTKRGGENPTYDYEDEVMEYEDNYYMGMSDYDWMDSDGSSGWY